MKRLKTKIFMGIVATMIGSMWLSGGEIHAQQISEDELTEITATETTVTEFVTTAQEQTEITTEQEQTATTEEVVTVVKKGYVISASGTALQCMYNGELQKDVYLAVVKKNGNYTVVKPGKKGSRIYYFNKKGKGKLNNKTAFVSVTYKKNTTKYYVKKGQLGTGWYKKGKKKYYYADGRMVTGWKKIKGKTYYFSKEKTNKGVLQTGTIAGSKKDGYFYVDTQGVKVTAEAIKLAVQFVNKHTKSTWSKEKKLSACFNYLWKNYPYQRSYGTPTAKTMSEYAEDMLKNKQGNCFKYAASFACIAKVLGYEARVAVGETSSLYGGMTPHGWAEIKVGNQWYICDANMQRSYPNINAYLRTEGNYPYSHNCFTRYTLNLKNGKVSWK